MRDGVTYEVTTGPEPEAEGGMVESPSISKCIGQIKSIVERKGSRRDPGRGSNVGWESPRVSRKGVNRSKGYRNGSRLLER